jgi:hypothetical protein
VKRRFRRRLVAAAVLLACVAAATSYASTRMIGTRVDAPETPPGAVPAPAGTGTMAPSRADAQTYATAPRPTAEQAQILSSTETEVV